ncbi:MAG TPA: L-2-amino-thiazoline-4-carboxylic acid hydrolase [Rhodoblastus sp.]|nr:L-2-amino-thiazoline-4-carboxylic acid hydrolase [Rhodoblastus sp.]
MTEPSMSGHADATPDLAPMLERRRIEAEILAHVYETVKAAHGVGEARRIVADAVRQSAIAQGKTMAEAQGGAPGLRGFEAIQPLWTRGGALEVNVREKGANVFAFDVTRCRYAEMYRAMGLAEIGPLLSCQRDGSFCEGYDPRIKFTRTQTIMQGASHCDFRYEYDADDPSEAEGGST